MMESAQLLALLHLTDSSFPTGAFSHAYGLETYTQQGLVHDSDTLIAYLTSRLVDGMARFDFILLHEAMCTDIDALMSLDELVSAMLTVFELREASMQVGRRFLKAALPLYASERTRYYAQTVQSKQMSGHFMLAFGVAAADLHLSTETALLAYAQGFVMGQAAAAMKLINIGQTRTQHVIRAVQPIIQDTVTASMSCTVDDLHVFNPAYDIRAMQHEYLFRRLFIS